MRPNQLPLMYTEGAPANLCSNAGAPVPRVAQAAVRVPAAINPLPLLLAGPILRWTTSRGIWIWLALSEPLEVHGVVRRPPAQGPAAPMGWTDIGAGTSVSHALGDHLHIAMVHIRPPDDASF